MADMVVLDRLSRNFGPIRAVREISFRVGRGEVVGFLGPNGAGKTTTMRMLTGFLPPSAGTARVCGHDVVSEPLAVRRNLGYLPEGAPLYGDMTVQAFLAFVAAVRGLAGAAGRRAIGAAVERTQLQPVLHQPIDTLSKGYKRRVGLAQAILHDPPVLILDEPTDGLDPNQKYEVRRLIAEMAPGKAIIVSTHILEEVEAVCTRAIVVARGQLVADATPEELRRLSPLHNALRLRVAAATAERAREVLAHLSGVRELQLSLPVDGVAELLVLPQDGVELAPEAVARLRAERVEVRELSVERGRLDDVFRRLTLG
ncbi:putative ABC transporter ATP-binding protein YxlF [bacterium HR40]|nr:putative ABC transporter ATP-binding protein YxlF [bacterium HR40]